MKIQTVSNSRPNKLTACFRFFVISCFISLFLFTAAVAQNDPVDLNTAGDFVILANTGITNTTDGGAVTSITGDIGGNTTNGNITGFALVSSADNQYWTSSFVTGKVFSTDRDVPTPQKMTDASNDMLGAYNDAAGRTGAASLASEIGGSTITPGVYSNAGVVTINSDVTLDGGPNDVFIFQIAGGITQGANTNIILTGGVSAENIFWQSASTVALGAGAHFEGIVLSQTDITLENEASVNGRLLAQTAVTLIDNNVSILPSLVEITSDCWRMLSSPEVDLTYANLLSPLVDVGYDDIFTWPIGTTWVNDDSWEHVSDMNAVIPAGHGFIVSAPVGGTYPVTLSVSGNENPAPVTVVSNTTAAEGWMLLGNPFQSFIDIEMLLSGAVGIQAAVYIWNPAILDYIVWTPSTDPEQILDGKISPFQGFFVEKSAIESTVTFTDAMKSAGGQFYGKKAIDNTFRLVLSGEGLTSSLGMHFSVDGSFDKTRGDAYQLQPLSHEFATLSVMKSDNSLYTVGHFPMPTQDFEVPVDVNVTRAGDFTISASHFNLSHTGDLYFNDLIEGISILIDENFSYDFSSSQLSKVETNEFGCAVNSGLQKAVASDLTNRFVISSSPIEAAVELPDEIALMQNYPNPFNPSTVIEYNLPEQSDVTLAIYDMLGRRIATLVNETQAAGRYHVSWDANGISSGSYLYRLEAGGKTITHQMTFIK